MFMNKHVFAKLQFYWCVNSGICCVKVHKSNIRLTFLLEGENRQ